MFRRRRAPRPRDQEWLRLILLVRKLQHGQYAMVQRLDDVRSLSALLAGFRSDFLPLQEELAAARESAGELERDLARRLETLHGSSEPEEEHVALERRLAQLDALAARLETLTAQVPTELPFTAELGTTLAELKDLAGRFEATQQAESAVGGQSELAALYERIQDLAEGLAREPAPGTVSESAPVDDGLREQLERIESAVLELQSARALELEIEGVTPGAGLARLEQLAERLERHSGPRAGPEPATGEFPRLFARLEELTRRLEETPAGMPDLPPDTITDGLDARALEAELSEVRATLSCEQEARRRVEAELDSLRAELRKLEMTRAETETRHVNDLTQLADHAQRQILRVEDDLKKKKRGLADLTQQNITLQSEVNRLKAELAAAGVSSPLPSAPAPAGKPSLAKLMAREPESAGEPQEKSEATRRSHEPESAG